MKKVRKIGMILIILLGISEIALRFFFGFCNAPLYVSDPDFEYVLAPNQYRYRFQNLVKTNAFSMRSEAIMASDTTVVLLIGDSVINGGNPTDQADLASTILEKQLSEHYQQSIRVLNISAGSWGPDNAFAFLKKKGFFGADLVCLITSSHDAYDNMSHQPIVGINANYPDKQYSLALYELWHRYVYQLFIYHYVEVPLKEKIGPLLQSAPGDVIHKFGTTFNPGFQQLADTTRALKIPFLIYLHPELPELLARQYDRQGREIIVFAQKNGVPLVQELALKPSEALFRNPTFDSIHYNERGQAFMAQQLFPIFKKYLDSYFHARPNRSQPTLGAL